MNLIDLRTEAHNEGTLMNFIEPIRERVLDYLQMLRRKILTTIPTAICNVGTIVRDKEIAVYASFLSTVQSETLDLSIYFKNVDRGLLFSADLVRGSQGVIFSEIEGKLLLSDETDLEKFQEEINKYIFSQEQRIILELKRM